jgi:outer membrane protein assembly factor BamD (BamD/ComL family)
MCKKLIVILSFQLIIFGLIIVGFLYADNADIELLRNYFLDKEYHNVIKHAEEILHHSSLPDEVAEAYFYLGQSQMRLGYYREARDSFRTIIRRFSKSDFVQRAYLNVADCFFLEENFTKAIEIYKAFLKKYPHSDFLSIVYFRLGQTNLKLGNWKIAKDYLKELKIKFPNSFEAQQAKILLTRDEFFTVQVGAFINSKSAKKLNNKLKNEGFNSYLVKTTDADGKVLYRVRVGKLPNRYEAEALQAALAVKGYPTRIYP